MPHTLIAALLQGYKTRRKAQICVVQTEKKGNTDFANMLQQLSHDTVITKDNRNQHSDT